MQIRVTQEDIEQGRHCDPDCCPVGRVITRAGIAHLGVLGATVMVEESHQHVAALELPDEVSNWILCYDGFYHVEPISFELEVPEQE